MRLRLPPEVYQTCVRQAELVAIAGDVVTIGVADAHLKEALGHEYASLLRLALSDVLGHCVTVQVMMRMTT